MKSEHDIQNEIRLRLSDLGYCVFRINTGKFRLADGRWFDVGVPKGFSDLEAVKNGRIYFIEVKNETGETSPEQDKFLATMRDRYGCVAGVCRSAEEAVTLCEQRNVRVEEIELAAAHNTRPPEYMSAPELCLYTTLRALYKSFQRHDISRESAQVEKHKIIAECERYEAEYIAWTAAVKYYQDNIRKASTLLSAVEKATSLRSAAMYLAEAVSAMTGDHGELYKRMKNKFEEDIDEMYKTPDEVRKGN